MAGDGARDERPGIAGTKRGGDDTVEVVVR
jgi:hypothetical protein